MKKLVQSAYYSENAMKKSTHYHDCHQIILVVDGQIEFCVNEAIQRATAGDIVIFSRYEHHAITVLSERYKRYILRIDPMVNSRENRLYSLFSNRPAGLNNVLPAAGKTADFVRLFQQITEERETASPLSDELLELLINQLLIMIYRQMPEALQLLKDTRFDTVADIQRRFESHPAENYSLSGLSREYHISSSSLSHLFKKITGSPVMDYLLSCRIAAAKRYLSHGNLSIGEIVERSGFSDNSNFSRTFKRVTGLTPTAFREKYKRA